MLYNRRTMKVSSNITAPASAGVSIASNEVRHFAGAAFALANRPGTQPVAGPTPMGSCYSPCGKDG